MSSCLELDDSLGGDGADRTAQGALAEEMVSSQQVNRGH